MAVVGLDNLRVYELAERGSIEVYNVTKEFPKGEWFRGRSVDQLRRSSESVANNIAEGYSRNSKKDKLRILRAVIETYTELLKTLHGYIRYVTENQ